MRRALGTNALSLVFLAFFVLALAGQAVAGWQDFNNRQLSDGGAPVGFVDFVLSSDFAVDVTENWQSEYLQFTLFVLATVWLVQRGSPESKSPKDIGLESDEKQMVGRYATERSPKWAKAAGWRTALYSNSLGLVMAGLFLMSWLAQSVAGWSAFNGEQLADLEDPVSWAGYLASSDFWNRSLQNWQSELLAVGSMAVFSVYLRQRGSPESKPVGSPHTSTNESG